MSRDDLVREFRAGNLSFPGQFSPCSEASVRALRADKRFIELLSIDGRDSPGNCARIYAELKVHGDDSILRKVLIDDWGILPEQWARINVCYAAYNADAMSIQTALELFFHPASGTHERHLIVAGLSVTEKVRNLGEPLYQLAEHIGTYDNPQRQDTLNKFLRSLKKFQEQRANELSHVA